jgi:Tfp pilus assembly protein PilO
VGLFLDRVAKLPRIVNVLDLSMTPGGNREHPGGGLVTSCTATTYKFVDTPPVQSKGNPPSRKRE